MIHYMLFFFAITNFNHLCRAITLLQSEGPALGIHINMSKCEVFSSHSLDLFPLGMISSDKPNLVILGAPIGNKEFCSFVSKGLKNLAGLWSQLEEVGLIDPQVALVVHFASLFI